jgi:hypothetical protein
MSIATCAHAQTTSVGSSDYFPLAVGDSWTYQATGSFLGNPINSEMTFEITGTRNVAGTNCYVLQYTIQGEVNQQCLGWQGQHLFIYQKVQNGTDLELNSPQIELQLPLFVGQHWTWSGSFLNYANSEITTGSMTCDVTQQSTVSVPAGTYQDYAVTVQLTTEPTYDTPSATLTQKLWFVDGIGLVKEEDNISSGDSVITLSAELTQYNLVTPLNNLVYVGLALAVVAVIVLGVLLLRRIRSDSSQPATSTPVESRPAEDFSQPIPPISSALTKFCRKCGAKIPRDSEFCEECGTRLTD